MATKVRYAPSGGLNVRSSAAGTKILALNAGDLMYDIAGVAEVTKSLNGVSYIWTKVHYYKVGTTTQEGDGWITKSNTTEISTTVPSKSDVYSSNSSLKQYQQLTNARYIYNYLKKKGWSSNAIYAMLGNMEKESYLNPGCWEETNNTKLGYGLTHWTPATKYIDWLSKGADKSDIDNQLSRILYEVSNNLQWTSKLHSPAMSFADFTVSIKAPSVLSEYFTRCYENPKNVNSEVPLRQTNTAKWHKLLGFFI